MPGDARDVVRRHLIGEFVDDQERVAGHGPGVGAGVVGMVVILEGQRPVGADPSGEVGVAACDEHQVAVEGAVLADPVGAIDARVEAIVRTQQLQGGALRHELGSRCGHEQLVGIEREHQPVAVEIVELHAEAGAAILGPTDDLLDPFGERGRRGCRGGTRRDGLSTEGARAEGDELQQADGCLVHALASGEGGAHGAAQRGP